MSNDGIIAIASRFSVAETIERLAQTVTALGLTVFARIDHAQGALAQGMPLRPTQLLIFGNPKGGTPLMQDNQAAGLDLPVKALAWQDEAGKVWLSINDIQWVAQRHGLGTNSAAAVQAIAGGLQKVTRIAAGLDD